jgi:hypothetical protein
MTVHANKLWLGCHQSSFSWKRSGSDLRWMFLSQEHNRWTIAFSVHGFFYAVLLLQGRGNGRQSVIDFKTGTGRGAEARPRMYPPSDSEKSALGQSQLATTANHGPTSSAKDRKTKGSNAHYPEDQKYTCELCHCSIGNKRDLIRQHEESKKHQNAVNAAASKARQWHCETCNVHFPNTPEAVQEHMNSSEHERMTRMSAEQQRDGAPLAKKQRQENGGKRK